MERVIRTPSLKTRDERNEIIDLQNEQQRKLSFTTIYQIN